MKREVSFEVNGQPVNVWVKPSARLIDVLREELGLLGTKEGCGNGECGACTVLFDGRPVNACLLAVLEAEGSKITTVEGLVAPGGELGPVQRAFVEKGGIQCGFCSPGMIMATEALLSEKPTPSDGEIREALVGNLCRCTGYVQIVESVRLAQKLRAGSGGGHG